jgi:hypothetical protein
MSIAILTQVYDEMRRLAIAGGSVASGDFRLNKLVAPLEKAGEKAPVFAKVAQAAKAVVESTEQTASSALLELATLVNAILYTQGTTGLTGELQPIPTTELGAMPTQTSARLLKPLLEALSNTGSGRLEIIKDAYERGAFADLRLVRPALTGLDDSYPDIGDFLADNVLPRYGPAILPELRKQFDLQGKSGHLRRLRLMHALDPQGTRELVKQVLDEGSRELRVVAIECLGESDEDLSFLLDQSRAKSKEVRTAALRALTKVDSAAAIEAVQKAAAKDDLDALVDSLRDSSHPVLAKFVLAEADRQLTALLKLKDKKDQTPAVQRLLLWLHCLDGRDDPDVEAFLLSIFGKAAVLADIKSEPSGSDVNELVAALLAHGSPKCRQALIAAQELLSGPMLSQAFFAARRSLDPAQVFKLFSPCLSAQPEKKSKKNAQAFGRLEAIRHGLISATENALYLYRRRFHRWTNAEESPLPPLDPRWLDVAVEGGHLDVVLPLARPEHAAANRFLSEQFATKNQRYHVQILETMVRIQHPEATDAVVQTLTQSAKSTSDAYVAYWIGRLIPDLPPAAAARLEALLPTLPEKTVDRLIGFVLELKQKSTAATAE